MSDRRCPRCGVYYPPQSFGAQTWCARCMLKDAKTKRCSKCKAELELNNDNYYRDKHAPDGYMAKCKACYNGRRYHKPKVKRHIICSNCGAAIEGKGTTGYCRACFLEYQRRYRRRERQIEPEEADPYEDPDAGHPKPSGYAICQPGRWL